MGHLVRHSWTSDIAGLGIPRRDRASGSYRAYIPDSLAGRNVSLDGDVAADAADAAVAIARLDAKAIALANTEALARLLLRAESVASSHIEGLHVSPQRLLRADIKKAEGLPVADETVIEVLANVDAMAYAVQGTGDITIERLAEVHRRLLAPTRATAHAGSIRSEQNWIGGCNYNPIGATFVPPPPEEVRRLLADLCKFCDDDTLPAIAQAAMAHSQFETIHPFADGNGRTGRALIYMVLRRRGLAIRATPPISLVLAKRSKEYVARLDATRYAGSSSTPVALKATNRWIAFFAAACVRAVADAELFEQRVSEIQSDWRNRLSGTRGHSTALALVNWLPAAPIISVKVAAEMTGRTFVATNNAIAALVNAKILTPTKTNQRNRTFEARELIDAFTALERQPTRAVPARPSR